jgi:two-component system, NtrC family, nitrogen regulation sensor histidine kinase NtrY
MKIRIGLRSIIILLFLILITVSMGIVYRFFLQKQQDIETAFERSHFDKSFGQLHFKTSSDSLIAKDVLKQYGDLRVLVKMANQEAKVYSSVYLLLILLFSGIIFIIIICMISRPLIEMRDATERIKRGDFSVHLTENGIAEMKALKRSFNDMSHELYSVQNRLLVAEKEMIWKDLSRILAHEIKNPLTPIQLTIERLEEIYTSDPKKFADIFPESIHIMNQEIENLRLLSQEFSHFAKINQPQFEVFDPAEVVSEIIGSYRSDYHFVTDIKEGYKIQFDKMHFYQVVTNILQNALDVSPKEAPIEITLELNHGFIVLTIKDNGTGIDADDLPRIFEPYFSRKNKGTGLGLALVKRLLDANQGFVRVKSKIGEGSQFEILMEEAVENPDH